MKSYIENIIDLIGETEKITISFIETLNIIHREDDSYSRVIVVAPNTYYDANLDSSQKILQIDALKKFENLKEQINFISKVFSQSDMQHLSELLDSIQNHLNLKGGWSVGNTKDQNVENIKSKFSELIDNLSNFVVTNNDEIYVIDTNSLLLNYNFKDYKTISPNNSFKILILPTVLKELDELKIKHQNPELRDKAKKIINILKGLRTQGNLLDGVKVHETITISSFPKEPNFENMLTWLQPNNNDDRIIASILELQRENISHKYILISNDINLQNKAYFAKIPFMEPPEN